MRCTTCKRDKSPGEFISIKFFICQSCVQEKLDLAKSASPLTKKALRRAQLSATARPQFQRR